jgi:hypothetical protein
VLQLAFVNERVLVESVSCAFVARMMETVLVGSDVRTTVYVSVAPPSVAAAVVLETVTPEVSSSRIVYVRAEFDPRTAFVGLESVRTIVSFVSAIASSMMVRGIGSKYPLRQSWRLQRRGYSQRRRQWQCR